MHSKAPPLISLLLLLSLSSAAQVPRFYLGFDQILDNREYFTKYGMHQTIFGARINPGLSVGFDSMHSVHAGVNYMYEYGGKLLGVTPQIDLYYAYSGEKVQARFGSFRRSEVMEYPLLLLTDSITYYRPNVEGASLGYHWEWGHVHAWVDWMGRENDSTREAIHAGADARVRFRMLYLQAISTRYHLARTTSPADMNQIRDDGSILVMAGADLSEYLFLDRLEVAAGLASFYKKQRPSSYYQWFNGLYGQLELDYWLAGLKASYYYGDPPPLVLGDPLFTSGNYGRLDLFLDPFRNNSRISSKISFNLHFLPYDGIYMSQQILITVALGR
jgi:hypothetical protein